ncbi:magnesium and cobalt transport protein CorA [Noviherbaspirillum pedocola]|uniref:Magnesium and cobalt transport protein CorA n=1 Tax=Noviherbaspirillum pedocola TaxID=2801341 RepID=A0A934T1Q3_9BURK|nr:magnesium and cobalt transport protein CorA [Noviherbaspirillum pedocola]MBK4737189.1 magnesium and cobalt transport protein CorA [Noviherbaspirillum pedocola]
MIINCVVYQHGEKFADIPTVEISEYLERPDCFVWVGMKDATQEELEEMREEFCLHPLAVEDALVGHQRPKIEEYGDSLFAVLRPAELVNGDIHISELAIFVGCNYVLSVRRDSSQGFQDVRARCEREPELLRQGSGFVLYALMDAVVDRYLPVNDVLEAELETVEESIFNVGAQRSNIQRLYSLKRKAMRLKHAVGPLLDTTGKLYGGRVPRPVLKSDEYFRDVYDHLQRLNQSIDGIRDTISTAIQVNLAMVAIDESEVNKRLAAWAAIFAVATAFAGIWGMNFEHMPELHWKYGYPAALGVMATVCLYLYRRFRRLKWL